MGAIVPMERDGSEFGEVHTSERSARRVGGIGVVGCFALLICTTVVVLGALLTVWPKPRSAPPPTTAPPHTSIVRLVVDANDRPEATRHDGDPIAGRTLDWVHESDERTLLLVVILAGALGSLVHSLRSFAWYVGNQELVWNWLPWYALLPFAGSTLALVFYLVIRAGFFSPTASLDQASPFGFGALGSLVGMFSVQALLKLKAVAETIFTQPQSGRNAAPSQLAVITPATVPTNPNPVPALATATRRAVPGDGDTLVVEGTGFITNSTADVAGRPRSVEYESPTRLVVQLDPEDAKALASGKSLSVVVVNPAPGGGRSNEIALTAGSTA